MKTAYVRGSLFWIGKSPDTWGFSFNEGCREFPLTLLPVVSLVGWADKLMLYVSLWLPGGSRKRWTWWLKKGKPLAPVVQFPHFVSKAYQREQ